MPDRAPSRQPRTGRSQCNRLCHNVIGCSTRPARPRRPGRRRWPTRYRPAARPASRWWGPTVPTRPTARTAPDRWPATTPRPRSAEIGDRHRHQLREAIGQIFAGGSVCGGLAGSPAVDDDVGAAGEFDQPLAVVRVGRVEHGAALVRVVQREAHAGAAQRRPPGARRAAARRLHLQDVGAQVGQQPGHRVAVVVGQVEYPQRRQRPPAGRQASGQRSCGVNLSLASMHR